MPISHLDVVVIVSDVILEPFLLLLTLKKSFRNTNKTNSLHTPDTHRIPMSISNVYLILSDPKTF